MQYTKNAAHRKRTGTLLQYTKITTHQMCTKCAPKMHQTCITAKLLYYHSSHLRDPNIGQKIPKKGPKMSKGIILGASLKRTHKVVYEIFLKKVLSKKESAICDITALTNGPDSPPNRPPKLTNQPRDKVTTYIGKLGPI